MYESPGGFKLLQQPPSKRLFEDLYVAMDGALYTHNAIRSGSRSRTDSEAHPSLLRLRARIRQNNNLETPWLIYLTQNFYGYMAGRLCLFVNQKREKYRVAARSMSCRGPHRIFKDTNLDMNLNLDPGDRFPRTLNI